MSIRSFTAPQRPCTFALTGGRETGKSSALAAFVVKVEKMGWRVGGVLQPAVHEGGERIGYDLLDVADGQRFPFARKKVVVGPGELSYAFDARGWTWARGRIRRARRTADLLVVDVLGKLEARGEGHMPALTPPRERGERALVWVLAVRDVALPSVQRQVGPAEAVFPLAVLGREVDGLVAAITRWLGPRPSP